MGNFSFDLDERFVELGISMTKKELFKRVKENGIVILDPPLKKDDRRLLYDLINCIKPYNAFSIGEGDLKRVVVRYAPYRKEKIPESSIMSTARVAYYTGDFETAIKYYNYALYSYWPAPFVFERLGVSYLQLGNLSLARDYLTVALDKDYNQKLEKLLSSVETAILKKGEPEGGTYQKGIPSEIVIFEQDNTKDIVASILDGKKIEELFEEYPMSDQEKMTVLLKAARESYKRSHFKKGDILLSTVEKMAGKTPLISHQIDEVRRNKAFYKNQINSRARF